MTNTSRTRARRILLNRGFKPISIGVLSYLSEGDSLRTACELATIQLIVLLDGFMSKDNEAIDKAKQKERFGFEEPIDLKTDKGVELLNSHSINFYIGEDEQHSDRKISLSEESGKYGKKQTSNDKFMQVHEGSHEYGKLKKLIKQLRKCTEIRDILYRNNKIFIHSTNGQQFLLHAGQYEGVIKHLRSWLKRNTSIQTLKI
jgi:hypothetical protein